MAKPTSEPTSEPKSVKLPRRSRIQSEDPAQLSADLSVELLRGQDAPGRRTDPGLESHRRRITYFMILRVIMLFGATVLVAIAPFLAREVPPDLEGADALQESLTWVTIVGGYLATVAAGWSMRRKGPNLRGRDLNRLSTLQAGADIVLAAAAVTLSGGVGSDLVFLFMVAVLGAALMGDRRQIWASAGICAAFFVFLSLAQSLELIQLDGGQTDLLEDDDIAVALVKTEAAIGLVAILSAYLNTQLLFSVSQAGSLRTLNENIVRSLTSGLLTVDHNGRVLFVNPTGRELLGRNDELAGLDSEELFPGLTKHLADSGGMRNRFELSLERFDDGRRVNIGLSCSPLLDKDGAFLGHVVNFRDVTELREMERVMRRNERLTALGGLAASVAHEVRNPLAAISGCAELLDTSNANEEDLRLVRVIRRESVRLNDIVTELLDYTRPRALQRSSVDLGKTLGELADAFRADPQNTAIELSTEIPRQPVVAELDANQLSQVLWNLVRNGSQAMALEGRLEIGVVASIDYVHLHVRDHGSGIAPEQLDHIFEPFFSTKEGGSGIGLALVQRIIEDHGGDIEVYSRVGEGTRFMINLPKQAPS